MSHSTQTASDHKQLSLPTIARVAGLTALGWLSAASPAAAHHAMDGRLPVNGFEGLISGLAHPVIGLDHFVYIVAIGLLCVKQRRAPLILAAFILAALSGTGIHLLELNLPGAELAVASSVIAIGALLAVPAVPPQLVAGLAMVAGLFHGYAYGEAIIGAEMSPLVAYLAGFSLIQYGVALSALWLGRRVSQKSAAQFVSISRWVGLAIAAIGVVFWFNALSIA